MLFAAQDPKASLPAEESGGAFAWLFDLVGQKGVLEFVLAATVLVVVWWLWWRMAALVQGVQQRKALADYLLGVEQALHGDLDGAFERLTAVVQTDPENHYARLLLGKVLAERGEPEQAHQQHLCLKNAFGIDTAANDRMLAQSLLAAGLPREAAEAAERSLQKDERSAVGWDFVYRARLQAGEFDAAAKAGKHLLQLLGDGGHTGCARTWRAPSRKLARRRSCAARPSRRRGCCSTPSRCPATSTRCRCWPPASTPNSAA